MGLFAKARARAAIRSADEKAQAGDYPAAFQAFEKVLGEFEGKDRAGLLNKMAMLSHRMGNHDQSEDLFKKALALDPRAVDYQYNYATLLADKDPHRGLEMAKQVFLKALNEPGGVPVELTIVLIRDTGMAHDAVAETLTFFRSMEDKSEKWKPFLRQQCAMLLSHKGKHDDALALLEDLGESEEIRFNRGMILMRLQRNKEAEDAFDRLSGARPGYGPPYYGLGYLKESQGDIKGAVEHYRAFLQLMSNNPPDPVRFAGVDLSLQAIEHAKEFVQRMQ